MKRRREFSRDFTWVYHDYNKKYFNGRLKNLEVFFQKFSKNKEKTNYGHTLISKKDGAIGIVLNKRIKGWHEVCKTVVLHEMIHVRFPYDPKVHGNKFKKERRRLIVAGAFDDLI